MADLRAWRLDRHLLFCIVIAGVAYLPTLRGDFVWDDELFITRWVGMQLSLSDVFFPTPTVVNMQYYRPTAMGSGSLAYLAFGASKEAWHAMNVATHMLTVGLLWFLLRRWLAALPGDEGPRRWAATIGAALYAVWPANGENVAWISARADTLLGPMLVGAAILHLRAFERDRRPFGAAALFLLALLCKETAVVFVPLLAATHLVLARKEGGATWQAHLRAWLPYVPAYLVYVLLRQRAMGSSSGLGTIAGSLLGSVVPDVVVRGWGFYVQELLLLGSAPPYLADPPHGGAVYFFAALGTVAMIAALAAALRPAHRPWSLAAIWIAIPLGPPLAVVSAPLSHNAVTLHYLYLPMIGMAALFAMIALRLAPRTEAFLQRHRRVAIAAGLAVLAGLAVESARRWSPWMSGLQLWARAVEDNPRDCLAYHNLALHTQPVDADRGADLFRVAAYNCDTPEDAKTSALVALAFHYVRRREFLEARASLRAAGERTGIRPVVSHALALSTLIRLTEEEVERGESRIRSAEVRQILVQLEGALRVDPHNAFARVTLGLIYESLNERVLARNHFRIVERSTTPTTGETHHIAVGRRKALDEAIANEIDPFRREYETAQALDLEGRIAEAREAYGRALALEPGRLEVVAALAEILFREGKPLEAATMLETVLDGDGRDSPTLWLNLGFYRSEGGAVQEAESAFARAVELSPRWAKLRMVRGTNFERMGQPDAARDEYLIALSLEPSILEASALRGALERAVSTIERRNASTQRR